MGRNTLIQVRRGTTVQWSGQNPVLSQGEWGYNTDLGRFKIGDSLTSWNDLLWASIRPTSNDIVGSDGIGIDLSCCATGNIPLANIKVTGILSSQINNFNTSVSGLLPDITGVSGVSTLFDSSSNTWTVYLDNPSIEVGDITDFDERVDDRVAELLGVPSESPFRNISGINLSYLDNDNRIDIGLDTTVVRTTGDQTISGSLEVSGVNVRNITNSIVVTEDVGGLAKGTTLSSASGITEILRTILEKVFEPTPGAAANFSVGLSNTAAQEVGTNLNNFTITANSVSSGTILGTGLGSNWNSSAVQRSRVGAPTRYTIDSVDRGLNNSYNRGTYTVGPSNSFSIMIDYASGTIPVNSLGNISISQDWASITQATSVTRSASFVGYRGLFYGWDKNSTSIPATSDNIRSLNSVTSDASGTMVIATNKPYTINLSVPIGTKRIVVAVPSGSNGYQTFGNNISVINAANLGETYDTTTVSVSGANGYTAIPYFVHYYIPAAPIGANTTHTITVS